MHRTIDLVRSTTGLLDSSQLQAKGTDSSSENNHATGLLFRLRQRAGLMHTTMVVITLTLLGPSSAIYTLLGTEYPGEYTNSKGGWSTQHQIILYILHLVHTTAS